jgi:predicted DsbA family dithiol-disulfide isomerase
MKIEIYSDVVCPWCYIGERRFARALSAFRGADEVEVVFRPFQLDPEAPSIAEPLAEYLDRRFGGRAAGMREHVSAMAALEGVTIDWESALSTNTRTAHRLLALAAREHGGELQRALAERLFGLHFSRGGDLGDVGQLAAEAASVGMDAARVRAYLESEEGLEELEAEVQRARDLGIRAVPTFVFDGSAAISGAQPAETFLQALTEHARASHSDVEAADDGAACHDDACAI